MKKKVWLGAFVLLVVGASITFAHNTYRYENEYFEPIAPEQDYGSVKRLQGDFRQNRIGGTETDAIWTKGNVTVRKPDGSTKEMDTEVAGFRVNVHEWDGANNGNPLQYRTFGNGE